MELKELLGDELYAKVDEKLQKHNNGEPNKQKHVRYADLSEGTKQTQQHFRARSQACRKRQRRRITSQVKRFAESWHIRPRLLE